MPNPLTRCVSRHVAAALLLVSTPLAAAAETPATLPPVHFQLKITSPLEYSNTPFDPLIDFAELIREAGHEGVVDPDSIQVWDIAGRRIIPHALSEDIYYGDQAKVEFVIADPAHTEYEIRFGVVSSRLPRHSSEFIPQIGLGDLLRYNAAELRPIAIPYSPGLHDLNGDGWMDLTGAWNYAHRPGYPWDGAIVHPRRHPEKFVFGDLIRLRHLSGENGAPSFFSGTYMGVDFADFNGDDRLDVVATQNSTKSATFFLNTGQREVSGFPQFKAAHSIPIDGWQACRAVDMNNDGAIDLVVDGRYIRNDNPDGWPLQPGASVDLNAGQRPDFLDLDKDGFLDAVCLQSGRTDQPDFFQVAWRRNRGGTQPTFGNERLLSEIIEPEISSVSVWNNDDRSGLIVQYNAFQKIAIYELESKPATTRQAGSTGRRPLTNRGRAQSVSPVMSLSDQAWPHLCDWDNDGDLDLLIGGGYGWLRIVINDGTSERPAFCEPARILSGDKPIRFLRNEILGEPPNNHNMGYCYPVFVDWNSDGLKDLVCPNETNRIFWYPNTGTKKAPRFQERRQILCDGYADSPKLRSVSNQRANDPKSNNGVYPLEEGRPFMWRTGIGIADFNGDTLMDLVTHDGHSRVATLFVQYRDHNGNVRLRKERPLKLTDGRFIDDQIVERRAHWTESFRTIDWNADGLQDLIYSVSGAHNGTKDNGSIYLLINVGSRTDPVFASPRTMCCFGEPIRVTNHGPHPWCGDFDGDGKPDLIACVEWSVYPFYSHAALMMQERPSYTIQLR